MADAGYLQIAADLRNAIADGFYHDGDQLPSEADLMEQYCVSRSTVRNAIRTLAEEGFARSEHGKGTFAVDPGERPRGTDEAIAAAALRKGLVIAELRAYESYLRAELARVRRALADLAG